jgi:PA14 domain/Bacterial Ig domain
MRRRSTRLPWLSLCSVGLMGLLGGCSAFSDGKAADAGARISESAISNPKPAAPPTTDRFAPPRVMPDGPGTDMTATDGPVASTTTVYTVNVRDLARVKPMPAGPKLNIEKLVPEMDKEKRPKRTFDPPNDLPLGGVTPERRTTTETFFPTVDADSSGFIPPDPTLAVGPNHVVVTVNSSLGIYTKTGGDPSIVSLQGAGGLFGATGAGDFVFDPKCFYDHLSQRFVVVALELFFDGNIGNAGSWILVAVSQSSDPNGGWKVFRNNAKTIVPVGGNPIPMWFDYPGFGYDSQGYYLSGNLFDFNGSFFGGVLFRIIKKSEVFSSSTTLTVRDIRDPAAASVQAAQHLGTAPPPAPYFLSVNTSGNTRLRVHAIRNPVSDSPQLVSQTVTIPEFFPPFFYPAECGGGVVNVVDERIFNATWLNGDLYGAHNTSDIEDYTIARWYHIKTDGWPESSGKTPALVQSGEINATTNDGKKLHTFFPAIVPNIDGDVAVVLGIAEEGGCVSVAATGRKPTDNLGAMGAVATIKRSDAPNPPEQERWGDYYGIALDPTDSTKFWAVGQYSKPLSSGQNGWATWVFGFGVGEYPGLFAEDDGVTGDPIIAFADSNRNIDVLANDSDSEGNDFSISEFDAITPNGAAVFLSVGTGPEGRDELVYQANPDYEGVDEFTYTIQNTLAETDSAIVRVQSVSAGSLRDPDPSGSTEPGLNVKYYKNLNPFLTSLPDFSASIADQVDVVPDINYTETVGNFATSAEPDNVGAVFDGFIDVPQSDFYRFCLRSDAGSVMFIGDDLVLGNDGLQNMSTQACVGDVGVGLKKGTHRFRVEFFETDGPAGLILSVTGGGLSGEPVPASWFLRPVVCIADFDQSGFVDIDDYVAFVAAFELGDQSADVDGTGFVDIEDFTLFVVRFEAGC